MQQLLSQPAIQSFITAAILGIIYYLVGKAGSALEALGAQRGWPVAIAVGKRLEAMAYDGPKLKGQPGAPETTPAE